MPAVLFGVGSHAPPLCTDMPPIQTRPLAQPPSLQSAFLHQMWHFNLLGGIQMRAGARAAIFDKAMRLRNIDVAVGDVVTLALNDSQRLMDMGLVRPPLLFLLPLPFPLLSHFLSLSSRWRFSCGFVCLLLGVPIVAGLSCTKKSPCECPFGCRGLPPAF